MQGEQDDGRPPDEGDGDATRPAGVYQDVSQPDLWATRLDAWVNNLNIERLRAQLAAATDEHQRSVLSRLLREHEADRRRLSISVDPDAQTGGNET